jgi:dethiobiotin synthetase
LPDRASRTEPTPAPAATPPTEPASLAAALSPTNSASSPAPPSPTDLAFLPGGPSPTEPAPVPAVPELIAPVSAAPVSPAPGVPSPGAGGPEPGGLPADGEALGAEVSAELAAQSPTPQPAPQRAEHGEWRGIVLVTGTDTDVGKTIVTAAVAAAAQASGLRVAVVKPGQTGVAGGGPTDIDVITRLAAPDTTRTLAEYPEPMSPLAAATVASMPPLELYEVVDAIRAEADKHDLVLVEGAGGLLVPMGVRPGGDPWTLADLATTLGVPAIVVSRAGLGTLNHTALTLEALNRRGIAAGVVIGAWPADPELVHWANLSELVPHLVGALPQGAGRMDPGVFRRSAPGWLTPLLYGGIENWRVWAEEIGEGHH